MDIPYMWMINDIWIISWFNHIAFDANPIWKSPIRAIEGWAVESILGVKSFFELQCFALKLTTCLEG